MPSFKKSLAWLVFLVLCGLSVIPIFVISIGLPAIPGAPMFMGAMGLGIFVAVKIYGAYADFRVELLKRTGISGIAKKSRLKTARGSRKVWRNRLMEAKSNNDREYAIRGLLSAEEDIANLLGVPYEVPEEFRSLRRR